MYRRTLLLAVLSACWGTPTPAAPPRETNIAITVDQVELANGLKLIVVPEPTANHVSVTVRYGVGSVDDPPGREGIAHLVEHMMFEHVRDGEALFDFLDRSALGFTGFTTLSSTVYSEHAPPQQLAELLAVELARLQQPCDSITESAFARQRDIVRNELREREGDAGMLDALHAGVFSMAHPIGRPRATIDSVTAITRAEACAFAASYYAASNAVLVISGPVTAHEARRLVDGTLGRVARGAPSTPRTLATKAERRSVTLDAPVDGALFVLAWPMPATTVERTRLRAVASMVVDLVRARVNGAVTLTELGVGAARRIAIVVAPAPEIALADAVDSTKYVLARTGPWFGSGLYEHAKNRAVYELAASLEQSVERDLGLADEVASGGDARTSSNESLRALIAMSRDAAHDLVRSHLNPDTATVVTLRPAKQGPRARDTVGSTFRELRRRRADDPAEASRPAPVPAVNDPFERARSRTLANGLQLVLLPMSTMPTVDIRLILPTGTAHEPDGKRGIALIAAHAMQPPFDTTMFRFVQSGGQIDRDVGLDHTELSVAGLAANLDILLSGLAITVREGMYDHDDVRDVVTWLARRSSNDRADRIANAAWRDAMFGDHPYRLAAQWAHADRAATNLTALKRYHAEHYRPAGATLIIAGRFEPGTAERWVDYYFKEWSGTPPAQRDRAATQRPLAFAQRQAGPQLAVQMAFPAPTTDDATLQILVEMIEETIADVREEIAASYGVRARIVRRRMSTTIELGGFVDASRASDALGLLRDRLAKLRESGDATAALFVSARRHVLARLVAFDTTASALADRVADEVVTGRWPSSSASIERARQVTIDKVAPLFGKLDVSQATMLLRGPERALRDAYAAIGRDPAVLMPD